MEDEKDKQSMNRFEVQGPRAVASAEETKSVQLELLECQNILFLVKRTLDERANDVYGGYDRELGQELTGMANILDDVYWRLRAVTRCDCVEEIEFPV